MANNTTSSFEIRFRYQSQHIPFSDWISLFTVCLAPLIAHLISGVPKVVYLDRKAPSWHEKIVHYNPTSVVWRYYAIAGRRARARSWSGVTVAASNALFWTSQGWDGSEAMIVKSQAICIQQPPSLARRIFSKDALKTIVVTLQGVQAIYLIGGQYYTGFTGFSLDSIFMPLAIIGLLRLPSAIWLTDEYIFQDQENFQVSSRNDSAPSVNDSGSDKEVRPFVDSVVEPLTPSRSSETTNPELFRKVTCIVSLAVHVFYAAFLLGCLTLTLYRSFPRRNEGGITPLTALLASWSYAILLLVSVILYFIYWFRTRSSAPSTVIPCISSIWYKIYTGFLVAIFVMLIVVASLETRRLPCGPYTSNPSNYDSFFCPDLPQTNGTASP